MDLNHYATFYTDTFFSSVLQDALMVCGLPHRLVADTFIRYCDKKACMRLLSIGIHDFSDWELRKLLWLLNAMISSWFHLFQVITTVRLNMVDSFVQLPLNLDTDLHLHQT